MPIHNYSPSLYPFNSKWVNIDSNRIHFIDEGQGDIILFCHPPITSSFMYRNMIPALSKEFRCIAFDFPEFGLSEAAPGYTPSIKSQAAIVEQLLVYLNATSVYFVMQEVGGHAGISVFMKYPRWLKGIILTDTIIFPVSQYSKIKIMLTIVNSGFFNFINSNFNLLIKILITSGVKRRKMSRQEKDTYLMMFSTRKIRRTVTALLHQLADGQILMEQIQEAFETTFREIPALLIYGEKDSLTRLGVPRRIRTMMPNSELCLIEGEKHFPHEGAPQEMVQLIRMWILKIESKTKG